MQSETERCNEERATPVGADFRAYRGLKIALRIYHKIELIPPAPVLLLFQQDNILRALDWGARALHVDCLRLETLRKSLN